MPEKLREAWEKLLGRMGEQFDDLPREKQLIMQELFGLGFYAGAVAQLKHSLHGSKS